MRSSTWALLLAALVPRVVEPVGLAAFDWVPDPLQCSMCRTAKMVGRVGDCVCDFEDVDSATHAYFHPLLTKLQQTAYFRFFKVNLDKACPFWDDSDALCALKDCAVETCEPDEIPPPFWLDEDAATTPAPAATTPAATANETSVGSGAAARCSEAGEAAGPSEHEQDQRSFEQVKRVNLMQEELGVARWSEGQSEDVWIEQDEAGGMVYVDLLENPERYTGYTGPSARRVWAAIHEENCFAGGSHQCLEKRIFYRLMSGLQASISTHIAREFYYGGDFGEAGYWAPNTRLFVERVGKHPDRLHNLYFTYLFVLRALAKAGPEIEAHACHTGDAEDDSRARALLRALVRPDHPLLDDKATTAAAVCQRGFDESRLFQAGGARADRLSELERYMALREALELKAEFQTRFRNISRIMDCVGCEKCRLWGKLQVLGIGTALKILMSSEEGGGYTLQRNEAIALLNTLAQLSTSVQSVQTWRRREIQGALGLLAGRITLAVGVLALVSYLLCHQQRRGQGDEENKRHS